MLSIICLTAVLLVVPVSCQEESPVDDLGKYVPPQIPAGAYLAETFDKGLGNRWVKSAATKEGAEADIAKYSGEWNVQQPDEPSLAGDVGLVLTSKARLAAITTKLDRPYKFSGNPFIVQYEVKYQSGLECGGSYIKLLSETPGLDLKQVTDKTGYTIMFGPDTCGTDKHLHFIMRHRNPKTGEFEEKKAKKPEGAKLDFYKDKKTHLFRLTVNPDNSWETHVDDEMVNSGNLLTDMEPAINPPAEIPDPEDQKPTDWDDRAKITDPEATKPIDWDEDAAEFVPDEDAVKPAGWLDDEPELIPDPTAVKPDDWDVDMDGEWEAPSIENEACANAPGCGEWQRPTKRNPNYKGKWMPQLIDNPDYSGEWAPRNIPNPDFFEDQEPYKMTSIGALAFELWSMSEGIMFDNILITDSIQAADSWTAATWHNKRNGEQAVAAQNSPSWSDWLAQVTEEKPWIWAVVIVGTLIPICLVAYCCCMSGPDEAAVTKKTDRQTADDDQPFDSAADEEGEEDEAAEEVPQDGAGDKAAVSEKSPSKKGRDAAKSSDKEEPEVEEASSQEEAEETSQAEQSEQKRMSPRKRKPRLV